MAQAILTLTTDFGLSDHYAGAMKGVILGICAGARIVDISHQVAPFQIAEGAYLIAQAYACFPKKTVHVAVVDPGVGSARRAILVEAAGQYFVGPDNGIFGMVMAREKFRARAISNEEYFRHPVSRTFHGRDIFAPVAAHLAAGVAASRMGGPIRDPAQLDLGRDEGEARVLHVDRFGNIVTNLRAAEWDAAFELRIGRHRISEVAAHYAASAPGKLFLIEGSSGYLEISLKGDSAARRTACRPGMAIGIRRH
jgi:S-adenosylmethionine hydrolase